MILHVILIVDKRHVVKKKKGGLTEKNLKICTGQFLRMPLTEEKHLALKQKANILTWDSKIEKKLHISADK